jgi:dynein heavy chain
MDEVSRNEADFAWQTEMQYYWDHEGNSVKVKMLNFTFNYGFEYLGNSERLVFTSLTKRCYGTLLSAIQLGIGGAPSGPAGAGKTETVKDLAKSLGKLCIVLYVNNFKYSMVFEFASSLQLLCFHKKNMTIIQTAP